MPCEFGSFHEDRIDDCISREMRVITEQRCDVVELRSGREERNLRWSRPRRRWDIGYGVRSDEAFQRVRDFWYARDGLAHGFRGRDWSDYKTNLHEITPFDQHLLDLKAHDGNPVIDLYRHYSSGGRTRSVRVYKPRPCGLRIAVDGIELKAGWALDPTRGRIEFETLPSGNCMTWGGFYDWPMRFEADSFTAGSEGTESYGIPNISTIELIDEGDIWPQTNHDVLRAYLGSHDVALEQFSNQVIDFQQKIKEFRV